MKVYFITRFSIYDPQFGGFRLTTDYDQKEYERRLFDKDRLNHKFDEFQNITLPSIVEQSCDDWEWLIYTSDRIPDEYMKRLSVLVKDYTNIVLITVKDFSDFFEKDSSYNYDNSFATVRIDDDDGLNNCFVERLQQYSENVGSIVSFTEGILVKYVKGRVVKGEKVSEKNIALGMAGIGIKIYNLGRHTTINNKYNVICDSTPDMFLLNCSPFTDTKRGFTTLERILVKFKRLLFLISFRPREVPRELSAFIQKRVRH
jgi:Putative rhamnosyl transferase